MSEKTILDSPYPDFSRLSILPVNKDETIWTNLCSFTIEHESLDVVRVTFQLHKFLTSSRVPHPQRLLGWTGHDDTPHRIHRNTVDGIFVAVQRWCYQRTTNHHHHLLMSVTLNNKHQTLGGRTSMGDPNSNKDRQPPISETSIFEYLV